MAFRGLKSRDNRQWLPQLSKTFRIQPSPAEHIKVVSLCLGTLCVESSIACRVCWLVQGNFRLDVETGEFTDSEILVMLGENGTGKTTFIRMIAGLAPPDEQEGVEIPQFNVSYKPQKISPKFPGTVSSFILRHSFNSFILSILSTYLFIYLSPHWIYLVTKLVSY